MHDLAPMLLAQTHADLARETILRLPQQTNPVLDYFATEFAKRAHAHYGSPLEAEVTRSAAWLSGNLRAVRKAEMPAKPG